MVIFLIANTAKQAAQSLENGPSPQKIWWVIIGFYALYFGYTSFLAVNGSFSGNSLPPKVLVFTTLPLFVFYFGIVFRSKLYWQLLQKAKLSSLVQIHTFRLVGFIFLIAYYYGALPARFAIHSGLGDVLSALGAFVMVWAINTQKVWRYKATLLWNIFGFWDIVLVIVSAFLTTRASINEGTQSITIMGQFPYCWIAAFAPATIIFVHISIFKKLKMEQKG